MQFPPLAPLTPSQSHRGVVEDLDAVGFHIRTQSESMSLLQHNWQMKKYIYTEFTRNIKINSVFYFIFFKSYVLCTHQ